MGYSCTLDASNMLGVISHTFSTNGNRNILTLNDKQYFFERGREQPDGAITGRLMECLPGDMCRDVGGVKIDPDGRIARFPKLSTNQRKHLETLFNDMRARNPQLLSSWRYGTL